MAWICNDCGKEVVYVCNAGCTIEYEIGENKELGEASLSCVDDMYDGGYYCDCRLPHDIDDIDQSATWED